MRTEIKLINNPFDINNVGSYYRKKDFEVASAQEYQRLHPLAQYEVEQEPEERQEDRMEQLNSFALDYPNHTFVTFLSSV